MKKIVILGAGISGHTAALFLKRYLNNETTPLFNIISKERRFHIESQDIHIQPVQKDGDNG